MKLACHITIFLIVVPIHPKYFGICLLVLRNANVHKRLVSHGRVHVIYALIIPVNGHANSHSFIDLILILREPKRLDELTK